MAWQLCCPSVSAALCSSQMQRRAMRAGLGAQCTTTKFTNSEGCVFNKLVFLNWYAAQFDDYITRTTA